MQYNDKVNYYDVLGLEKKATDDEIKKAYRKLSLQFHPDRDGGDEAKYKEVVNAYTTLSDKEKRRSYDFENSVPFQRMNAMHFNNEDLINILLQGEKDFVNVNDFPFPENSFFFPPSSRKTKSNQKEVPQPMSKTIKVTFNQAYTGCVLPVLIERKNNKTSESETIYVEIPQGVDNNEFITVEKKGNIIDDIKGDIKIIVVVTNDTIFQRDGLDLIHTHTISLKEALCGFDFNISHISGKMLNFNNNPGNIISSNFKKTIPNLGFKRDDHIGNFIISFNIIFPSELSKDKIKQLNNIL
jgi:DnaJ-class molecular chaperone